MQQTQTHAPATMTVSEVAAELNAGKSTVYGMLRGDGPLSHLAVYVGIGQRNVRVKRQGFYEWLERGGAQEGR